MSNDDYDTERIKKLDEAVVNLTFVMGLIFVALAFVMGLIFVFS